MDSFLLWIYITNSTLLIIHEIESAYWKEWELFRLPGKITGFLLLHFPIIFLILFGVLEIYAKTVIGYIISITVGLGGIFAFSIHTYFIRKGKDSFNLVISKIILVLTLFLSLIQIGATIYIIYT